MVGYGSGGRSAPSYLNVRLNPLTSALAHSQEQAGVPSTAAVGRAVPVLVVAAPVTLRKMQGLHTFLWARVEGG